MPLVSKEVCLQLYQGLQPSKYLQIIQAKKKLNDAKKLPILDANRKYSTKPKKRHNIVGYRFLFCQENIFFQIC